MPFLVERALAVVAIALAAGAVHADVFSPGPLSSPHAKLEGLANCTKCHVAGSRLAPDTCLSCHTELKDRLAKRAGFHGRLAPEQIACQKCHREHQGRDFHLVDWGKGGKESFDHRKTGFVLEGKHAQAACLACHNDRLIADPSVRALRARAPQRATFLGAAVQCSACHFDEHRGQLGTSCKDCHSEAGWAPAPRFSHARTNFPLQGKHVGVECLKCHVKMVDADPHKQAPTPPRSEAFSRFRPVAHASCLDCHKDPHAGRLGDNCMSCHTANGWTQVRAGPLERGFHERTRYPLRGAHVEVACRSCHGPFNGVAAKFKGLAFERCSDCHVDAHLGQLGSPPARCDSCHTIESFRLARYEPADHTRYPLAGAHLVVACSSCHRNDPALAARAAPIRAFLERRLRKDRISLTQFHPPGNTARCDTCHKDPHGAQFAPRVKEWGCAECHRVESFNRVQFDHAKDSTFPLTGAHAQVACASCHVRDAAGVVRYRPVKASCVSCHADVHEGQLSSAPGSPTDCARCHATARWKETSFVHGPPWTTFELQGKHAAVACADCHKEVDVGSRKPTRRYRGLPTTCAGCHVDAHRGAFREFVR
jgi:hypothetical protein